MESIGVLGGELSSGFVKALRAGPRRERKHPETSAPLLRLPGPCPRSPSGEEFNARRTLVFHLLRDSPWLVFSLGEKPAPPVSHVVSGDFSGILGLLSQGVGWIRSENLIATSYLLFFPCLVSILFVHKLLDFFSLSPINIHFLLVERDYWNPVEETTLTPECPL